MKKGPAHFKHEYDLFYHYIKGRSFRHEKSGRIFVAIDLVFDHHTNDALILYQESIEYGLQKLPTFSRSLEDFKKKFVEVKSFSISVSEEDKEAIEKLLEERKRIREKNGD